MKETKRPVGKPPLPKGQATVKHSVCLKPSELKYITKKYGSASAAIRLLVEGGEYEQMKNRSS